MKALLIVIGTIGYFTVGYIVLVALAAHLKESLEDAAGDKFELGIVIAFWPLMAAVFIMLILTDIAKFIGLRIIAMAATLKAWIDVMFRGDKDA